MKFLSIFIAALSTAAVSGFELRPEEEARDRWICTSCSGTNTGCASTEYCFAGQIFSPSCCRTKLAAGEVCVPKLAGGDCTSGTCNNLIPTFTFLGVLWNFGALNPFFGTCT